MQNLKDIQSYHTVPFYQLITMSYFPQTTRATIGRRAPQAQRRYGNGPESILLNSHPSRRIQSTMPTTSAPEPEQYQPQDDRFDIDMSSVM